MTEWVEGDYPTELALNTLRGWHIRGHDDIVRALEFARSIWHWPEFATRDGDTWTFVTGGWPGNEDIIEAMADNKVLDLAAWKLSEYGGRHVYQIKGDHDD